MYIAIYVHTKLSFKVVIQHNYLLYKNDIKNNYELFAVKHVKLYCIVNSKRTVVNPMC